MTDPTPTVRPVAYEVSCLPPDVEYGLFDLRVEYRGHGQWAVLDRGYCLGADGEWDWEPSPSSREDDWLAAHRFDLDTALKLAKEAAPHVTVSGRTVVDALARAGASRG